MYQKLIGTSSPGLATVRDDYFSELVIYLSLLVVAENPNL